MTHRRQCCCGHKCSSGCCGCTQIKMTISGGTAWDGEYLSTAFNPGGAATCAYSFSVAGHTINLWYEHFGNPCVYYLDFQNLAGDLATAGYYPPYTMTWGSDTTCFPAGSVGTFTGPSAPTMSVKMECAEWGP